LKVRPKSQIKTVILFMSYSGFMSVVE